MDDVFLVAVPFMAVAFVIALTMREKPLRGRGAAGRSHDPARRPDSALASDDTLGRIRRTPFGMAHWLLSRYLLQACHADVGMLMPTRENAQAARGCRSRLAGDHSGRLRGQCSGRRQQRCSQPAGRVCRDRAVPDANADSPIRSRFKSNVKDGASNVKVNTLVTVKADWRTLTKVKLSYTDTDRTGP